MNAPVDARICRRVDVVVTAGRTNRAGGPDVLTVTSVLDGRAHKVTDAELCAPHSMRTGRYAALCGHLVSPAPLIDVAGTPCARCVQLDPTPPAEETSRRPARRRGWGLRRVLPA